MTAGIRLYVIITLRFVTFLSCTDLPLVHEVEEKSEVISFDVPQQDDWVGMVIEQATQPTVAASILKNKVFKITRGHGKLRLSR